MSQIGTQRDDRVGRPEAAAQQADDVQVAEPFTIGDIALAAGHVLDVAGVDEDDVNAAGFEDLEDGNPVHAGGFHRHVRDQTGDQPVGEPVQIAREGGKRSDRRGVAIGRHGDEMFGRAAIDPGSMGVDTIEHIVAASALADLIVRAVLLAQSDLAKPTEASARVLLRGSEGW